MILGAAEERSLDPLTGPPEAAVFPSSFCPDERTSAARMIPDHLRHLLSYSLCQRTLISSLA